MSDFIVQAPLRQAKRLQKEPAFVHVLFISTDLVNWHEESKCYKETSKNYFLCLISLTGETSWSY